MPKLVCVNGFHDERNSFRLGLVPRGVGAHNGQILTEAHQLFAVEQVVVFNRSLNRDEHFAAHVVMLPCCVLDPVDDHRCVVACGHADVHPWSARNLRAQSFGDLLSVHVPEW